MQISELAAKTGVSVHALRHYEKLGLIAPARRPSGYRDYPESMRREVVFIAMSRRIGFSLKSIGERLPAYRAGRLSTAQMIEALHERIAQVDTQIQALRAQRRRIVEHVAWLKAQQHRKDKPREAPGRAPR